MYYNISMRKIASFRLKESTIAMIEVKSSIMRMNKSEYVEYTIEKDRGMFGTVRNEKAINGHKFYPTHMNNEELHLIVSEFISREKTSEITEVRIRKGHGGKGVEFEFNNFYLSEEHEEHEERRYTFSIDPNWEINDYFDHWHPGFEAYQQHPTTIVACEKIKDLQLKSINEITDEKIKKTEDKIVRNPLFENDEWKIVFEHRSIYHLMR